MVSRHGMESSLKFHHMAAWYRLQALTLKDGLSSWYDSEQTVSWSYSRSLSNPIVVVVLIEVVAWSYSQQRTSLMFHMAWYPPQASTSWVMHHERLNVCQFQSFLSPHHSIVFHFSPWDEYQWIHLSYQIVPYSLQCYKSNELIKYNLPHHFHQSQLYILILSGMNAPLSWIFFIVQVWGDLFTCTPPCPCFQFDCFIMGNVFPWTWITIKE